MRLGHYFTTSPLHYPGDTAPNDPQSQAFFVACSVRTAASCAGLALNGMDSSI